VTHAHLDHILGIGGLVSTYLRWEAMQELEIYAGSSALERIEDLLFRVVIRGAKTPFPIRLIPIKEGVIIEENDFSIAAFSVAHRGPDCYGFSFEEKGKRPFLAHKAEELNIPQGPWRRDLVNGHGTSLPDGRQVSPEQVLGEYEPGIKLVMVGDAGETESLLPYCRDAEALVIEGTYLQAEAEMAKQFSHLTAADAAGLASAAGVKKLFITHISRRYRDKDVEREAQAIFPTAHVVHDFDLYAIKRS